ncbi:MAG: AIR synthase family protein [Sulfolobales archaeon]|nr:AIR synthase family protein [Sulfolobales archaeon]MCX8198778.1 AIR synthase family protein [Sulfolobales archaeon]MDW8169851.1 AIR synthase family protein [Desulfurococcaceae archaeon]
MTVGKPKREILESMVFKYTGINDPDVVQGPAFGEDAGIVRLGDGYLVTHTNPITTASRRIGWLSINVAANDVAVRGARPRWAESVVLMPPNSPEDLVNEIMSDVDKAAKKIGISIIGGHTEYTPGLPRPIVISTVIGYTNKRVVTTKGAQLEDLVIAAGYIGGEGTSVIAWDFPHLLTEKGLSPDVIVEARKFIDRVSIVEAALRIAPYASSMHDLTEGGLLEGLYEVSIASGVRLVIDPSLIQLNSVVAMVTGALNIDPLKLLSSGSLVATIPEPYVERAVSSLLEIGIPCSVIGRVVSGEPGVVLSSSGRVLNEVRESIIDEIYKLFQKM